jgi:hypothetical protein
MPYHTVRAALTIAVVGAFVLMSSTPVETQSSPFAGTWVLDLDQSDFMPAQFAPDAKTVSMELVGDQLRQTSRTVRGSGRGSVTEVSYTVGFDGAEVTIPASGVRIALKRIDANTFERIARGDRGQMETSTWSVSRDRGTLTITTEGTDAFGATYSSTQVLTLDSGD